MCWVETSVAVQGVSRLPRTYASQGTSALLRETGSRSQKTLLTFLEGRKFRIALEQKQSDLGMYFWA